MCTANSVRQSAVCGYVRQCAAVCGSVRQCAAVCGSVRQCAAVCGSVRQLCEDSSGVKYDAKIFNTKVRDTPPCQFIRTAWHTVDFVSALQSWNSLNSRFAVT
jgi:hypothetical protein